jgi:hypothetical protein
LRRNGFAGRRSDAARSVDGSSDTIFVAAAFAKIRHHLRVGEIRGDQLRVGVWVAGWSLFKPNIPIWVHFGGPWNGKSCHIFWSFGILYENLYILLPFVNFVVEPRKIWQPWWASQLHLQTGWPGANPTIASYNASVLNFYNATGSLARFDNKNMSFNCEKRSSLLQRPKSPKK